MSQNRILIVEDDQFIREMYEHELQKANYEVVTAMDAESAAGIIDKESFQLVLLDIILPVKSGLDLLKELHEKGLSKKINIIMLTNVGQEEIVKQGFQYGAKGYLIKSSFTPQQVVTEINSYFNR